MRGFAAQGLLPGERHHIELRPIEILGEAGARGSQMVIPILSLSDEVGVWDPNARSRAIPGKMRSQSGRTRVRSGREP